MSISFENIDFSQLSAPERLMLAQALWDSVPPATEADLLPLTEEQITEIRRRVAAVDAGEMSRHSWESVKAELSKRK